MNKKSTCLIEADKFNTEYADIQASAKLMYKELKKNMSSIEKLSKRATKLLKYGNNKCYTDTDNGPMPIGGIKNIHDKMVNLEWIQDLKYDYDEIIAYLDI